MGLSLSPFQPGYVLRDESAPADPVTTFLKALQSGQEAGLTGYREQQQNSRNSAQLAMDQKRLDFQIAQEKTKQGQIKAQGDAMKILLPHLISTGQVPPQGGSGVGGANTPVPQPGGLPSIGQTPSQQPTPMAPADIYATFVQTLDPSIVKSLNDDVLPVVESAQKLYQKRQLGQATQRVLKADDVAAALANADPALMVDLLDQQAKVATVKRDQRRQEIGAKYAPVPGETTEQMITRLGKMSSELASAGDHAAVAALASDIGALKPPKEEYEWFQSPDGKSTVYLPKAEGSRLRLGKPITQSGFGFGPGGPLALMRAVSGVAGMGNADEQMRPYEIKVAAKQADLTDKDYFQGQIAALYNDQNKAAGLAGHIVPFFGTAAGTQMLERLNKSNPEYANYLQSAAQWALEDALLSNRPSDFRTRMDEFVSAVKPGAGAQSIHNLWASRSVRLNAYRRGLPAIQNLLDRAAAMPGVTTVLPAPEP